MTTLPDPAAYLESRYERTLALRLIIHRLIHHLYGDDAPDQGPERRRLKNRLERAQKHLYALGGAW